MLIAAGVLLFAWHISKTAGIFRWQSLAFDLLQAAAFVWLGLWLMRSLGNHPAPVRAELLKLGRCAACAYALREVPADADGVRRCPECSCCWRIAAQEHRSIVGRRDDSVDAPRANDAHART